MTSADPPQDIWSRLRDYCQHGHALKYPPLTDEQARELERHGIPIPPEERQHFTSTGHGFRQRSEIVCYPPATEEQLRATEEELGFPLPPDLRRLYAEVANGGLNLGPVHVFHGAIGGCGIYAMARHDGETIEALTSTSSWRLHPRIEEALQRHPGRYVVADSSPDGFTWIGWDSDLSLEIDGMTGRIYYTEGWGYLPDAPPEYEPGPFGLISIEAEAPSLSVWFERWLDGHTNLPLRERGPLLPEMVETDDLPDPDAVWRGLYRFGPNWHVWEQPPADTDLAHDAEHAIYWTYVEDAERGPNR